MPCGGSGAQGTLDVTGLYCALSFDQGQSWGTRRLITDDYSAKGHMQEGFDGKPFKRSYNAGEPDGYMSAAMDSEGNVNLITSRNHYVFNVEWLASSAPCAPSQESGAQVKND